LASLSRPADEATPMIYRYLRKVMIKDAVSGKETDVVEYTTSSNHVKDGRVIIAKAGLGDLIVGMTLNPRLDIYDLDGKKTRSIDLDIEPQILSLSILSFSLIFFRIFCLEMDTKWTQARLTTSMEIRK
jgi:hypothetical protein